MENKEKKIWVKPQLDELEKHVNSGGSKNTFETTTYYPMS